MNWVDLSALKAQMGIDNARRDGELQAALNGAISAAAAFIGADIALQEYAEQYDGNGKDRLVLRQYPVHQVLSVEIDGKPDAAWRNDDWLLMAQGAAFPRGVRNIKVRYTAGYDPIPDDIQAACIMIAQARLNDFENKGIQSKSLAGETITYSNFTQSRGIPPAALAILQNYVRQI
ncbi:MAG: phage gp6-like head-tail connector protein [Neisseria sp.]|nr:phage gp6-like head-tail connector protein [Neisseria sp.]